MDKPVLIIEAPELSDDTAIIVMDFLQDFLNAFDSHFHYRAQRHKQLLHRGSCTDEEADDDVENFEPF